MINYPILIVGGEPNSVFSEILIKSFNRSRKQKPILLFASYELLLKQLKILKLSCNFNLIDKDLTEHTLHKNKINIFDVNIILKNHLKKYQKNRIDIF